MNTEIKSFINQLPQDELYVLMRWPWVQTLMDYDWFRQECLLYQPFADQEYLDSSYFIPVKRLHEISEDIVVPWF